MVILVQILWRWSSKTWKQIVEDLLDDWEHSSIEFIKEYELLNGKYNELLKEIKSVDDDGK